MESSILLQLNVAIISTYNKNNLELFIEIKNLEQLESNYWIINILDTPKILKALDNHIEIWERKRIGSQNARIKKCGVCYIIIEGKSLYLQKQHS